MFSSYKRYTSNACEMQTKLSSAEQELASLREKLPLLKSKIHSMVPKIRRLSANPKKRSVEALNDFIMSDYHPALSSQAALVAQIDAQCKLIKEMQEAMLEPGYMADFQTQTTERIERAQRKAALELELTLIDEARRSFSEDRIREKLHTKVSVHDYDLTERPEILEEGCLAGIQYYDGPRSMAVRWWTPCVVLKRAEGALCVVCLLSEYSRNHLEYRLVKEARLRGPPKGY